MNPNSGGGQQIFVMDSVNGAGTQQLTNSGSNLLGDWSPDGSRIVFFKTGAGVDSESIYVMDSNGANVIELTPGMAQHQSWPIWSPDGNWIMFRSGDYISVMRPDGSGKITLDVEGRPRAWTP